MKKPLVIDLYCGLGGWAEGFLSEGYDVIGFDLERHDYGTGGYPGQLVLQDVQTLIGCQFKDADVIVGSSPCQEFSYRAMPWKKGKVIPPVILPEWWKKAESAMDTDERAEWEHWKITHPKPEPELGIALFNAQFRIQTEACIASGRHIPLIVENVRGAQRWVGPSRARFGSFHLWGDVPALMPITKQAKVSMPAGEDSLTIGFQQTAAMRYRNEVKNNGGSWFNIAHNTESGVGKNSVHELAGLKLPGNNGPRRWEDREIQRLADAGKKNSRGGSWFRIDGSGKTGPRNDPRDLRQQADGSWLSIEEINTNGVKGSTDQLGGDRRTWFDGGLTKFGSRSDSRKAASAQIAKIPFELSRYIARHFKNALDDGRME